MKRAMRYIIPGCLSVYLLVGHVAFAEGELVVSTAFRYDTAGDDASPETSGNEYTIPIGVRYQTESWYVHLQTAYSNAYVETGDVGDSKLSGLTDTLLSATYVYTFMSDSAGLTLGIDFSLPTGQENLSAKERSAEWGESNDLFEVDDFGEGLNIGLSCGLTRPFGEKIIGAIQAAYIVNGEYDPDQEYQDDDLDPGDQLLLAGTFDWQATPWLALNMFTFPSLTGRSPANVSAMRLGRVGTTA